MMQQDFIKMIMDVVSRVIGIHVYSMVTNYVYIQMQWRSTLYSANFVRKTLSSSVNHVRLDSAKAV